MSIGDEPTTNPNDTDEPRLNVWFTCNSPECAQRQSVCLSPGRSVEEFIQCMTSGGWAFKLRREDMTQIESATCPVCAAKSERADGVITAPQSTADLIASECDAIKEMLLSKNRKYGDSAIKPKRVFSKASAVEQILVRIDDKLSRIESAQNDEDEDVEKDLIGYLVLLRVARRSA